MSRSKMWVIWVLLGLGVVFLMTFSASAQVGGTAAVSGSVTDASGGVVPGVKITITNVDTGIANTVASDSQGKYTLPSLPVGNYNVSAEKEGFQQLTQTGVTLSVGKTTIVDVALRVGQVSQQVQVAAEAPVVETQDSAIGMLVGSQEVKDLPLNGRSYINLVTFSPGVTSIPNNTVSGFGEGTATRLSVNGARQEGQVYLTDNTDTKSLWGNSTGASMAGTTMGIDAIAEFQVLTNTYGAQYGGNGTVVNAAIRSGTNSWHGTVFDFERNQALDARNPFDPQTGPPPFYRHQFGAAGGGPIKKDKAFFFVNYEGLRQNLGLTTAPSLVPNANARLGLIPCALAPDVTCDSTTGLANMAAAFPAGFAKIQAVLNTFPSPNGSVVNAANAAVFHVENLQQPTSENFGVAKFDYNFSDKDSLLLTYIIDRAYLLQPNYIPTQALINNQMTNQVTIEEKRIISPTKINTVHFSYFRPQVTSVTPDTPALDIQPNHFGGSWGVTGSPWSGIGGGGIIFSYLNRWTLADQFFWSKGKHSLQMGLEFSRHEDNVNWPLGFQGSYTFSTIENFFKATPSTFSGPPPAFTDAMRGFRDSYIQPYFQDKYQITSRLTLTLGARYDFVSNITEAQNKFTNVLNLTGSTGFTAVPHAYYSNPTKTNIAPRIGFAWDPFGDHKTSVRAGFGMFYDMPIPAQLSLAYSTNPPYFSVTIANPPLPNPFGTGGGSLPARPNLSQGLLYGSPGEYPNHNPYLMQFNLNIQREILPNTVATIGYVGTQARHLYIKDNENPCLPTGATPAGILVRNYTTAAAVAGTCPTANPTFAQMSIAIPRGTSNYNALQASVTRSFTKGLEFSFAYTYSRCISQGDNYTGGDSINIGSRGGSAGGLYPGYVVYGNMNGDIGPCDFHLTHVFSSNVLYSLPFHGNRAVEGWQASLISSAHSGFLTTPLVGVDTANCGFNACAAIERPNIVAGCDLYAGAETVGQWFNTSCFTEPAIGVFGNVGRNVIKGPGFANFDLSLTKDTKITETTRLQIRAELFNFVNHTNLGFPGFQLFTALPNANTGVPGARNATAGVIQDTAGYTSRQIQLGAKFIF